MRPMTSLDASRKAPGLPSPLTPRAMSPTTRRPHPFLAMLLSAGPIRAWENPELTSLNKLPPRATFDAYPTAREALAGRRERSPWFLPLDGRWAFRFETDPVVAETAALTRGASGWSEITVPGNWQTQGHHFPHYTNVAMPFPEEPPHTPANNPTGVYRREIHIPAEWQGLRVILHFGSADSVLAVYLDGTPVGLSKDARLPAEFDLTALVRPGSSHELTAVVVQYSDASFIEDQDMWRLGGLPREVYLHATPAIHLADVQATPLVDLAAHTAELAVVARAGFPHDLPVSGVRVSLRLLDPAGRPVNREPLEAEVAHERRHIGFDRSHVRLSLPVPRARLRLWSHEDPALYTLLITVTPPADSGAAPSHSAIRVGFRKVEIRGRNLLINGRRVLIKGVNHHEHHPDLAKAVPLETLRRDVVLMKQFNFNAVRLSHYPHDPRFLDLCDELGLYVVDEANLEAHDYHNSLCRDPRYAAAWLDRAMRMVARDFNHPSIIAWSLGNESGYGPAHDAAAGWIRHQDPSRILHYEGAISLWQGSSTFAHGSAATDLICPMYTSIADLEAWLDFADRHAPTEPAPLADLLPAIDAAGLRYPRDGRPRPPLPTPIHPLLRPVVLCEYSHAMGNSNGSLADYYRLFKGRAGIQGGFIWEWLDHGLRARLPDGREYFAYGGDFGDKPNDANFVCDGLVSADREPHPACHEHHRLAQPISIELAGARGATVRLLVRNDHDFTALDAAGLRARWTLLADGAPVRSRALPAAALKGLAPGESRVIAVEIGTAPVGTRELHLNIEFTLARARAWAPAGHMIAAAQLTLPAPRRTRAPRPDRTLVPANASETTDRITLTAGGIVAVFERESALLISLRRDGRDLIVRGPRLQLWRGATDNDGIKLWSSQTNKALGRWQALGLDRGLESRPVGFSVSPVARDGSVTVTLAHAATTATRGRWEDVRHEHRYTLHPDGRLAVANVFELHADYADVPRVGVRLDLVPGLRSLTYFGRGPFENYCDRRVAADLGIWEGAVADEYVDYVMPQEHGHHCDVRWVELSGPARGGRPGPALGVEAAGTFEFNATHFAAEDLYAARHTTDLRARPETLLYLDAAHRGLGTASCGPDALPPYRIPAGRHELAFTLHASHTP